MIETSSKLKDKLNDKELMELGTILARVEGGKIPNPEALDGFFAALVCCPDLIMPGEYLPVIQSGETEAGDLNFESLEEAKRFMGLVMRHWNHVNGALNDGDIYLPLVLENDQGSYNGNDWAKGFMVGTYLRHSIWAELINDENNGGSIIPIMTLAYENDPDPAMRPFDEPISDSKRDEILIATAAGVMRMHAYFLSQRTDYLPTTGTFVRQGKKVGRNELCPCGSGAKYKKCCWSGPTIH